MKINLKISSLICSTLALLLLGSCTLKKAPQRAGLNLSNPQRQYISQHYQEAVRQMNRHGIPASITLAQGVLETGSGRSTLAKEHNNHFGIKCAGSWTGKKAYATDNRANECFRSYKKWQDSYEDHSLFLKKRRYHQLFNLRLTDYKGWAKGLQKCGYATSRTYAKGLIDLIERLDLNSFDKGAYPYWLSPKTALSHSYERAVPLKRTIYISSGLHYIIAVADDSFDAIAEDFDLYATDLARYNELEKDTPLHDGDIIYLEPKRTEALTDKLMHVVEEGESMYRIAQRYGMFIKSLYMLNGKSADYVPTVGDKLRLLRFR